jgi:hypothetical protein
VLEDIEVPHCAPEPLTFPLQAKARELRKKSIEFPPEMLNDYEQRRPIFMASKTRLRTERDIVITAYERPDADDYVPYDQRWKAYVQLTPEVRWTVTSGYPTEEEAIAALICQMTETGYRVTIL